MDEYEDERLMRLLKEMDEEDVAVPVQAEGSDGDGAVEAKEAGDVEETEEGDGESEAAEKSEGFNLSELSEEDLGEMKDCDTEVKVVGDYVAKITLRGGFVVPLKFHVLRRQGGANHHAK